jgi:hypothetical protein
MHYKTIEATVKPTGMPMHVLNAVYATELNKAKSPVTALLLEPLAPEQFPTFRDELRYVLKTTNGRATNDLMLYSGDRTLLLLACSRDHAEEIFDHYLNNLGAQGLSLAGYVHEYTPTPMAPEECKDARGFIRSRADRFYNELVNGLESVKQRAPRFIGETLEKLANGAPEEALRDA